MVDKPTVRASLNQKNRLRAKIIAVVNDVAVLRGGGGIVKNFINFKWGD